MLLGVDYGEMRVGLALCDERLSQVLPRPLQVFVRKGRERDLEALVTLARSQGVSLLVVGVGLAPDGGYGQRARQARNFGLALSEKSGLPVVFQDERDSSLEASERLAERGVSPRKRADLLDSMAAAIILERYLASLRQGCARRDPDVEE